MKRELKRKRKTHQRHKQGIEMEFKMHITVWACDPRCGWQPMGKGKPGQLHNSVFIRKEANQLLRKNCVTYRVSFFPINPKARPVKFFLGKQFWVNSMSQVTKWVRPQILLHVELFYRIWIQYSLLEKCFEACVTGILPLSK